MKPVARQNKSSLKAIKMTPDMLNGVIAAAGAVGQSDSEFIREAIREHLKRHNRKHGGVA